MNIIAHFDEIFLKGNNQGLFIKQLISNLESLFVGTKVKRVESGLWIEDFKENELNRLALIPGIANFSPAIKVDSEISKITKAITGIEWGSEIKTFRIKCERTDKKFPLESMEIEKEIGAAVNVKFGYKVKLKNPELTIHINIGQDGAIIFGNKIEGIGGLPVGTAGKIMCLLSGGIDSPVAAYKIMVRGAEIELVHFQNQTQVTEEVSQKIMDLAKVLSQYHGPIKLHIIPFAFWQKQIVMNVPSDYRMLITRRLMFKIATNIAKQHKCGAQVTGDSLGQVASQTLENLNVVYEASMMLKLTPLIAENKITIMRLARQIGTLEISDRPYEDCCSLFVAKHPQTHAQLDDILKIEKNLDLTALDKTSYISYHIGM